MKSRYGLLSTLTAIALFIVLETVAILLVVKDGVVQRYKVLGAVRSVEAWFWTKTSQASYYFNYKTENERLAAENLQLRQQLARYASAKAELDSVVRIVEPDYTFIGATVIRNSVDRQHNYLILDRGAKEGVEPGMGVVTARGVIGIVSAVSRHYAYVISLLNTEQSVSAKLAGSGAFGPMTWPGLAPDRAILSEIPVHVQAAPGDTVLSSGFSTIYPPDIPIGRVIDSKISQGSSQDLTVLLFEDFRSLHNVYIVQNNRGAEIRELNASAHEKDR
ncbi:MAG: rod shape-determining protein MreC [Bacteroidales bacterium]|nr:rod shape-determining protein MreC [Bacteroidales bacterium]